MVRIPFVSLVASFAFTVPLAAQASVSHGRVLTSVPPVAARLAPSSALGALSASTVSPGVSLGGGNSELELFSGAPMRIQQIYDHDSFSGTTSVVVRNLRYRVAQGRAGGGLGGHSVDLAVWMCYAPTAPKAITSQNFSWSFQENLDSKTLKQVIARKKFHMPTIYTQGFSLTLPLDANQSYALVLGLKRSLVVETRFYGAAQGPVPYYPLDALDTETLGEGTITANSNYQGCLSRSMYPIWHASHSYRLKVGNLSFYCTGDGRDSGLLSVMTVGSQAMSLPIPGATSYGIPCKIVNDVLFMIPGLTDSNGIFTAKMPIANNPLLVNKSFYTQVFFFDAGANSLGLTSSNGIQQTIGPGNPWPGGSVGICYAATQAPASTPDTIGRAQVRTSGVGLVTEFNN